MPEFTHAGGLVFQPRDGNIYYLIVRSKPDPSHWVIPKGHIEPDEGPEAAAIREIREEAGVMAQITASLGTLNFTYRDRKIATILYLLEFLGETQPQEERECHWGLYEETRELLTFPDTREMLFQAREILRQRGVQTIETV
jgi:8-oxo-dGTP pyrophosphatase MutT (NUDIX family)